MIRRVSALTRTRFAVAGILLLSACAGADAPSAPSVPDRVPTSVRLSEASIVVDDGQTHQLTASVLDQSGATFSALPSGVTLQWSSSDERIAAVSAAGVVTAHRPGQVQIAATVLPQNLNASATLTVRPVASALQLTSGNQQSGTVATPLELPTAVQVFDRHGTGVAGVQVTFAVTGGGGTVEPAAIATDATGHARATWTLGTAAGIHRLEARAGGLSGSPVAFEATGVPGASAALVRFSGDGQSAQVTTALPQPLVVRVTDAHGNAVSGASVTWSTSGSGSSITPAIATTDAAGEARGTWTLGVAAGAQTASASAAGTSVAFSAVAAPGPATALVRVSGDAQSGVVATNLAQPLLVRVTDAWGNPVVGAEVGWHVTAGGGTITPAAQSTNSQGQAQATWRLGSASGANAVRVTAAGAAVAFSATATPAPPSTLARVSGDGQNAPAGSALPQPLVVRLSDVHGNPIGGATVTFAVGTGGGSLQPVTATTAANGEAQSTWTLGPTTGAQSASAAAAGLPPVGFGAIATALTGSIRVTTQTTGTNPPAGYTLSIDGAAGQSIGASATLTVENVQPGSRTVLLSGIPQHCSVTNGANPRTVDVVAGATAEVAFELLCGPTTGSIRVTTQTTGINPPTGYTLSVDGAAGQSIGASATLTVENVQPGSRTVLLSGIPQHCSVANGANPRTVDVTAGATAEVTFEVLCSPTTGSIRVTTQTTGINPPTGYTLSVDGAAGQSIGASATLTVENVQPGSRTVLLSGIPQHCSVTNGANPRNVDVVAGATAEVAFELLCSPTTGSIRVTTQTTGTNPPTDYTLSVDGAAGQSIGASATLTVENVQPGSRTVLLSGIPQHCSVTNGANPRPVEVVAGQTAQINFEITCSTEPPPDVAGAWTYNATNLTGDGLTCTVANMALNLVQSGSTFSGQTSGGTLDCGGGPQALPAYPVLNGRLDAPTSVSFDIVDPQVWRNVGTISENGMSGTVTLRVQDQAGTTYTLSGTFSAQRGGPSTGSIRVTTQTTGQVPGGSYTVTAAGQSRSIGPNATETFSNVSTGPQTVQLSAVPANCTISGGATRPVSVTVGQTAEVTYQVACSAPTGSIQVSTQTTGPNPPSTYTVSVDGGAGQSIGANGTLTIAGQQPGTRNVLLSGIPSHCSVTNGANPRPVAVTAGQTAQTTFQISCSAGSPFAQVLVQPGFWVQDISGGGPRASVVRGFLPPNPAYCVPTPTPPPGTICGLGEQILYTQVQGPVFSFRYGLTPDDQLRLVFSSSEQQYLLLGYNQAADILTLRTTGGQDIQWHGCRSASTPQLVPLSVIMARCPGAGSGTVQVTTATQGPNQPSGYVVAVDGGTGHTIGVNGSRTIANVPAGMRSVLLSGVPSNCTVTNGSNPRSAVVVGSQTTHVAFEITCTAGGPPPNVAGFWTYNANNLTGQGLTCTISNLSLLLTQNGSIVAGQGSSGTLNCGWGPTPLEGLIVQNGQATAPNHVVFNLVDPTGILGPQSWHNQGTVAGGTMSGTATLQVRDLSGQVRTVSGPFLATRLIQ
jgi:hypothetical protein